MQRMINQYWKRKKTSDETLSSVATKVQKTKTNVSAQNSAISDPNLQILQSAKSRDKQYTRQFNANVYQRCEWICRCEHSNALFYFPCLLFGYDNVTLHGIKQD